MKTNLLFLSSVLLVPLSTKAYAEYQLTSGIGVGNIELSPSHSINHLGNTDSVLNIQALFGYKFTNNIVLDAGYFSHGSIDYLGMSDNFKANEIALFVGYKVKGTQNISFTPRVGYSSWSFESKEGWLTGSKSLKVFNDSGHDVVYNISITIRRFNISYHSFTPEFGAVKSVFLGMFFEL